MVSAVRADAAEVPCPGQNPLAQTVYPLQGGKVHPNFENKKKIFGKNSPLVKSVFKSVDN